MTQNGFTMYMLSKENDVFNQEHTHVSQDMSRPLAHYYISSSHNTYLTKDQVTGASSTEPYIRYTHTHTHTHVQFPPPCCPPSAKGRGNRGDLKRNWGR